MLSRSSAVIVSLTSLSAGIVLGVFLGRGGPDVSAQVAGAGRGNLGASLSLPSPATTSASRQRVADEAIYAGLAKQYEKFEQVDRTFELVAKAVSPSVVHIVAQKTARAEENRRVRHFEETGSGVIIRSDRAAGLFVLTNHHVVDGSKTSNIRVFLRDGRSILPVKIWTDGKADIAVLKLDRDDLPSARLGNSDEAAVGNWVMALGSPFGLMHSVSQGIISARGRHMDELPDVENQDFLQTDAAINPGNSGGPLVNMKGEVIGINNSIVSDGGGNQGVGFSIPINLARWIMNELIVHGRVTRGGLGVDLHPTFSAEKAIAVGMEWPRGAWIDLVREASPADKAGIRAGDVVLRFAGIDVVDLNHLINMVSMAPVGEAAEVVVWRDRREIKLKVTVGERERTLTQVTTPPADAVIDPSGLIRRPNRPNTRSNFALGLELATLNAELAQRFDLPESWRGALVVNVDAESPLSQVVQRADVISAIDNEVIQSSEQAVKILNQRTDHVQSIISLDRMVKGVMEQYKVRLP
jgi:serine protease Do